MIILTERPPNYAKILAAIPEVANYPNAVFCYGDAIYNPAGVELPPWIIAHEAIHVKRQHGDPEHWWDMYLASKLFRYNEELPAYRKQWRVYRQHVKDRNERARYINGIAQELASDAYGAQVSPAQARCLIRYG